MKRVWISLLVVLLLSSAAAAEDTEESKFYLDLSGFFAFNGYSQNNFYFGAPKTGGVTNKDEYSIQLFRLTGDFGFGENIKAVVRLDMAQGIWGIDNSQRDNFRPGFSNLFNNKDTNFEIHVDWAYVDWTIPKYGLNLKLGRMKYKLGNMLVLDQDNDGIQLAKKLGDGKGKLSFGWSKMSEGTDSLSDQDNSDVGAADHGDADLFYLGYTHAGSKWTFDPYLVYYDDKGTGDGTAYIPQGFQYFNARFRPQITDATILGLAFNYKGGSWTLKGEIDYLDGSDDIPNTNSGPKELLDVNNGSLEGYNLYLDARVNAGPGKLGLVAGMGSGDDDVMSGKGNINKIRTNGFFYITEVWEDSVMPDELGITPQGLGSPAHRGYREFENTTLLQLNYTWNINQSLTYFISGTWIQATEAIKEWSDLNNDGVISPDELGPGSSDDLGTELDMKLDWKLARGLVWTFRGGYFWTGDASGYLINGTNRYDDNAYELRTTIKYSFGGLRLGG